jgi:hypothetical protein
MRGDEAKEILGFAPNSHPNPSEVLLFQFIYLLSGIADRAASSITRYDHAKLKFLIKALDC